ncbi:DoxX family protein [bacterium]|nr:DoxX family protein [bacterium]
MSVNVATSASPSKAWTIGLWVLQVLLAAMFGMAGTMKATAPITQLAANMPWVAELPALVRFIGIAELAAALGLILPAATRILPFLTPLAGAGLALIMVLAAGFHGMRGEYGSIGMNVLLGALAILVAWGRFVKAPVSPRN